MCEMNAKISTSDRFWSKVDTSGECWLWIASRNADGYGRFRLNGTMTRSHRTAWLLVKGAIPDGLHVLHICDVPACVNPSHLYLGTHLQNVQDIVDRNRYRQGEAHHKSKLTADDVRQIRASTTGTTALAKRYGVAVPTICNIRSRRNWKAV